MSYIGRLGKRLFLNPSAFNSVFFPHQSFHPFSTIKNGDTSATIIKKKVQVQPEQSVLEQILLKPDQEPKTTAEKVENTFFYSIAAASVIAVSTLAYLLLNSFWASDSPQRIYSKSLKLLLQDERCLELFGKKISAYGEDTGRGNVVLVLIIIILGRRRHIANTRYVKDGNERIRIMFHLKGDKNRGKAFAEMVKIDGIWDYRFLYAETDGLVPETVGMKVDSLNGNGAALNNRCIMEMEDFIIVDSRNKKQRRLYFKKQSIPIKILPIYNDLDDSSFSIDKIERILNVKKAEISSIFLQKVVDMLSVLLEDRKLLCIRSIGLGHFSLDSCSAEQFVLLKTIQEYFNVKSVIMQDPRTSSLEKEYLKLSNFEVIPPDNLRKCPATSMNFEDGVMLVYMIHCENTMYDSILSSYWNLKSLKNIIIIGNDFFYVVNNLPSRFLKKVPVLEAYSKLCLSLKIGCNKSSFHTTAISYIPSDTARLGNVDFTDYVPSYKTF